MAGQHWGRWGRQWGRRCSTLGLVGVIFLAGSLVFAATKPPEPEIEIAFDRQAFVAGEPFRVQISVTTEGVGEPEISLPSFNGFKVLQKNVSKPSSGYSFSFSFGSGQNAQRVVKNSGTTTYDIVLQAPRPGKYAITPVTVKLDGFTFKGKSYPLEVFDRASANAQTPSAGQSTNAIEMSDSLTEEQLAGARIDSNYFLHMIPSAKSCRQGEQIILNVYLFASVGNVRLNQFDREPGTEGFWVERFEDFDLRNQRNQQVVINGTLYEQVLLKKLALFPLKSGQLTIAPPTVSLIEGGGGFGFFLRRGKEVKLTASPVGIDVSPLPQQGRPAGFTAANIGRFSFLVDASQTEVKVGEPVTVTVNVRGSGNIRNVELPAFGEVDGFKTYAPETDVDVQARGGMVSGVSQSQTLFIPEREGKLTIPSLSFTYFDLQTNTYKARKSDPIVVTVARGKKTAMAPMQSGGAAATRQETVVSAPVERMNAQMRTIVDDVDISKKGPPLFTRGWYLMLIFGVPALYFLYLIMLQWRQRAADNFQRSRSRRAEADARKRFGALEKEKGLSNDQFFSRLHKIVLTFLENRLEENVVGDTMNQLSERLLRRGISEELVRDVIASLEEYEFARFARSGGGDSERKGDLQRALALISKLGTVSPGPLEKKGGRP